MDIDRTTSGEITVSSTVSGDDAFDWATEGNTDVIPTTKLPPSTNNYVSSAALDVTGQELSLTLSITNLSDVTASVTLPAGSGGTGDDAFDWATEGNTDLIPRSKVYGEQLYYAPNGTFSNNILELTITQLGTNEVQSGDVVVFEVPFSIPSGNISVRINSTTSRLLYDQTNTVLDGDNLVGDGFYILVRDGTIYKLLDGSISDWAIVGNSTAIPTGKLVNILTRINAGTNITIDDSTSGQLTISASGSGGSSTFLDLTDTPSTFGTAGQLAVINSAEDALEFVSNRVLSGSPVYYSSSTSFNGSVLNISVPELGTDELSEGDVLIFLVPSSNIPTGNVFFSVNSNSLTTVRAQDNELLNGPSLRGATYHSVIRDTVIYRLLSGDTEEWALVGDTELIPNSKLDGLLTQIMAGTNITIDTSTAGQITIAGSLGDDAFDWATEGNTDIIPTTKLPTLIVDPNYYVNGVALSLASNVLTLSLDREGLTPISDTVNLTTVIVDHHVDTLDLTLSGNDLTLTLERIGLPNIFDTITLPAGSGGIGDDAYDWATEGNTDDIPNSKIDGLLSQIMAGTNITIDDTTSGQITIAASGGSTGDDAYDWATEGNTDLIPNSKLDGLLTQILAGTNITIDDSTAGEITYCI